MAQRTQDWIERLRVTGLLVAPTPENLPQHGRPVSDSREVLPGDIFVAVKGTQVDGNLFIDKAVENGAIAIVCEAAPTESVGAAVVRVSNSRRALTELVSLEKGDPGSQLALYATTGTNGKTTTATLIAESLSATGSPCGFIGTTGVRIGQTMREATHTTPSPHEYFGYLAEMVKAGYTACSMEASSHALDQERLRVADVDVAVFTNLTRDHLDYHHSFDAYLDAKKRLFAGLNPGAAAVLNRDEASFDALAASTSARILSYGTGEQADIRYRIHDEPLTGLDLEIDGQRATFRLAARYNAANLAAAYTALVAGGMDREVAFETLSKAPPVAGRFELNVLPDGTTIIVDYAHTPDALENVLRAARAGLAKGTRLWVVFGCGGDRDTGKRPEMGALAEKLADHVVVTSDNPRFEDPRTIMEDIRGGFINPEKALWIEERSKAIHEVAARAQPGDAVIIAGKGHETTQSIKGEKHHFDDRAVAREAFANARAHTGSSSRN